VALTNAGGRTRLLVAYVGKRTVDKLEYLSDIAADLDFMVEAVAAGDKPTGIFRAAISGHLIIN
jgi:hypothetical protein